MVFKKFALSLALVGLAMPGMIQASYWPAPAIKHPQPQIQSQFGDVQSPFNPKALKHQYSSGNDYYAYYENTAFDSDNPSYGYVVQLSRASISFLFEAYDWAQSHGQNPLGGIISYIIDKTTTPEHLMPYANKWSLSRYFWSDTNLIQSEGFLKSFAAGDNPAILDMIQNAYASFQTVNFYFFATYRSLARSTIEARIQLVNPSTQAAYQTAWQSYTNYPFTLNTLEHYYTEGDDYYAYYSNTAFESSQSSFGYVARLSSNSLDYLMKSYHYGLEHEQNALGSMISYLIDKPLYAYKGVATPDSNGWSLNRHFLDDINFAEGHAILNSFVAGNAETIINLLTDAENNDQPLTLFFSTTYLDDGHSTIQAKVEILNQSTDATYTTPWRSYKRYPFNPSALSHDYHSSTHYDDYYAYYANTAFDICPTDLLDYGYVATLSKESVADLMLAHNYAIANGKNGAGSMLAYLIYEHDDTQNWTPYANGWNLNDHFYRDANNAEGRAIMLSFLAGDENRIVQMVSDANAHQQTLEFYFYTNYRSESQQEIQSQVQIFNPETGATYTTPWQKYDRLYHYIFNQEALDNEHWDGDDYYAYYEADAFPFPFAGDEHDDYGYVAQLSQASTADLVTVYNNDKEKFPDLNANVAFVSYLTGHRDDSEWSLSGYLDDDMNSTEREALAYSAAGYSTTGAIDFVKNAVNRGQTLTFFLSTAYGDGWHIGIGGQVLMFNNATSDQYIFPWRSSKGDGLES